MRIKTIMSQKRTGNAWGYMVQAASQGAVLITVVNFFMLAATFFATALSPYLVDRGITIPFWVFMVALIVPLILTGLLLYKFAVPSFFSAFNDQFYKHNNLLRRDIDAIKEKLGIENEKKEED